MASCVSEAPTYGRIQTVGGRSYISIESWRILGIHVPIVEIRTVTRSIALPDLAGAGCMTRASVKVSVRCLLLPSRDTVSTATQESWKWSANPRRP